jgi:hypothetical protein
MAFDAGSVQRPSLRALYDFKGNGIDELSFKAGDVIFVVQDEREGWFQGELNGKRGFLPSTYVERMKVQKKTAQAKGNVGLRLGGEEKKKKKKSQWREIVSDEGEKYYYNDESGESRWDPPAEEEEEPSQPSFQMEKEKSCAFSGCSLKPFAGGKYCVSHQNADKKTASGYEASGSSSGNSVKSQGTSRGVPNFGSQPSTSNLNKSQPSMNSGMSSAKKVAPQPVGTGRPVVKSQPKMMPIPGKSGMANTGMGNTGSSTGRGTGMTGMSSGTSTGTGRGQTSSTPQMKTPIPKAPGPKSAPAKKKSDWIKVFDDSSGNYYFYNEKSQESVWEQPPGFF